MPTVNGNQAHLQHQVMPQRRTTLQDHRILIVEDEALVTMLLEDGLSEAGAEVVGSVGTVFEALQIIERMAPDGGLDAAILDINLVGESVTPVADQLAALGVPFVFATGYGTDCDMGAHAAAPVLHKPFATERLVAVLETIVLFTPDGAAAFWRD